MNNKATGKYGEEIAQKYLIKQGYKIIETNFRYSKMAEIDIIAQKNNVLHFVEVKTRTGNFFGSPFEAVSKTKLSSIYKCAKFYLTKNTARYKKIQIDAIGIILSENNEPDISFLEDISLN
ncbi:MAG: YraN family protein [Candidatus Gastranaerophilales bacterium]|nr:YraN family protein [Candidatus Gastranaerophilales bacterium]